MRAISKEVLFFLTSSDLVSIIQEFESQCEVRYYNTDIVSRDVVGITSLLTEYSLGQLTIGDWNHSPSYLVAAPRTKIIIEEIQLRKGGYSFSINQLDNPDSIVFKPSGILDIGILIAGSLTTVSSTAYSLNTFKVFSKIIKKYSNKVGSFYVGSDAYSKLKLGWRLVTTVSSPQEYDLSI